jgi:two-component system NtrC family sensor kinase
MTQGPSTYRKARLNTRLTVSALVTVSLLMVAMHWHLYLHAALIFAFGLLVSLGVIWLVTRRLTQPILHLIEHIDGALSIGDEWPPLDVKTGDEIERLAITFNNMMTEVRAARQAVADEKEFYSGIIQHAAVPMFVIDSKHTILFWNNSLAKLTGKSSFQMENTKQQWSPFYPSKRPVLADLVIDRKQGLIDELYTDFENVVIVDGTFKAEGWFDNLGGQRRYLFFAAVPIMNSRNEIVAAVETLEDITERKLAQEAMASHNLFLQEILDAIANPVFYKDTTGAYIGCNKSFQTFVGLDLKDMIGKTIADIMPGKYTVETERHDKEVIQERAGFSYEGELRRYDDQERTVLITKAPFFTSSGELGGIVGAFVDITEQRRMDEQIRKMSRAVEQSSATIVITNVDGVIEYVNPKFCQTTGYMAEEAIGQNPRILKSGEMPKDGYAELWKTLSAGKEWRGEFHNMRKDGTFYWEFASISPLYDKDGRLTGYLAVKEDITERKAVEAELVQNRLELEAKHVELGQLFEQVAHAKREWEQTLDHLRDFVILTDAGHRILRYNKLLSDATGRPINELIGADWRELIGEAGFRFVTFNGASGEIFHQASGRTYDITIYPIEDNTVVTGHVVSINDTTDLRATTQELEKAYAELKEAQLQIFQQEKMASIGQLAAGVAHEINNPMGFISSNLSTLNKYIERLAEFIAAGDQCLAGRIGDMESDTLNEVRKRLKVDFILEDSLQLIAESQDGAGRVRRIVQDLKSFSRVDQAECALINLNEALETTINIAWNEIKYVASLNREFGDIPQIKCYPQQLNQVFLNLLINAAHAMGEHPGAITVRTWSEKFDVFVSVADTGGGIPEEIQQRIFEPFFTTKEVGKGTGLGLSISYDIIHKHGGDITVKSQVGIGTTFTVRLPVNGPGAEGPTTGS